MSVKQQAQQNNQNAIHTAHNLPQQVEQVPVALAATRLYGRKASNSLSFKYSNSRVVQQSYMKQVQRHQGNEYVQRILQLTSGQYVSIGTLSSSIQRDENDGSNSTLTPTYYTYKRLDIDQRRRELSSAVQTERIRKAEVHGNQIIRQRRGGTERIYEQIPHFESVERESVVAANGVSIPVHNATADELIKLQTTLAPIPQAHLQEFMRRRRRIVLVDWTGAPHSSQRQYGGGAQMRRPRPEIAEEGSRIEITHTAMSEDGYRYTILHELGHVVYEAGLIPRQVHRDDYGSSVHQGPSEQPAYAYMWYFLNPSRLASKDRANFAARIAGDSTTRSDNPTSVILATEPDNDPVRLDNSPIEELFELYATTHRSHRLPTAGNIYGYDWIYGSAGSGHIRQTIRAKLETKTNRPELRTWFLNYVSSLSGPHERKRDLHLLVEDVFAQQGWRAPAPNHD